MRLRAEERRQEGSWNRFYVMLSRLQPFPQWELWHGWLILNLTLSTAKGDQCHLGDRSFLELFLLYTLETTALPTGRAWAWLISSESDTSSTAKGEQHLLGDRSFLELFRHYALKTAALCTARAWAWLIDSDTSSTAKGEQRHLGDRSFLELFLHYAFKAAALRTARAWAWLIGSEPDTSSTAKGEQRHLGDRSFLEPFLCSPLKTTALCTARARHGWSILNLTPSQPQKVNSIVVPVKGTLCCSNNSMRSAR